MAFDKELGRIRTFGLSELAVIPLESAHIEIGSGHDGANLYFSAKLQALDAKKLTVPQLAFFAMNASWVLAVVDRGVGRGAAL